MEIKETDSRNKGNVKATEALDLEDRGTETERGGKNPGGVAMARSESHCCIFGQELGPCDHLEHPKSGSEKRK